MPGKTVIVMIVAVSLAALAGCGGGDMSLSDYRTRISELHDGVAWDLAETLEEFKGLHFDDFYDLPELREVFGVAGDIFGTAWDTASSLSPPREADNFHDDLLDFYADGAESMRDRQNALGFFEAVLPMLRDVENLALPGIPEDAGVEEIRAAAVEDGKTMSGYLGELQGMDPPDDLSSYRERLSDFFRAIDEAAAGVDASVKPDELEAFVQFRQWFAAAMEEARALWSEAMAYLGGLSGSIDVYIEQGKELAERIHKL